MSFGLDGTFPFSMVGGVYTHIVQLGEFRPDGCGAKRLHIVFLMSWAPEARNSVRGDLV